MCPTVDCLYNDYKLWTFFWDKHPLCKVIAKHFPQVAIYLLPLKKLSITQFLTFIYVLLFTYGNQDKKKKKCFVEPFSGISREGA